jgi:hypothetical protein
VRAEPALDRAFGLWRGEERDGDGVLGTEFAPDVEVDLEQPAMPKVRYTT